MVSTERSEATGDNHKRAQKSASRQGWAVAVLAAVYACHVLDRSIIQVLLEPVKREFGLSDTQLGLLAGLIFAMGYAVAALPIGALADRFNRKTLLAVCIAVWSCLTVTCGLATNFVTLLIARLGVGAAEAGGQPLVMSILGDITTPERRARAVGLVHVGIPVGVLLGGVLGAFVVAEHGWRAALFIAGGPGILLALVVALTLREPPRKDEEATATEASGFGEYLRFLGARPELLCTLGGIVVLWFVSGGYAAFLVSLLVRIHHMPLKTAALAVTILSAACGALGNVLSGFVADRYTRGAPDRLALFAAGAALLHIPLSLLMVLAPNGVVALVGYGLMIVTYFSTFTPGNALAVTLATSRTRGRVVATVGVGATLLGYGLGPQVTGILSDLLEPSLGVQSIRWALFIVMLGMLLGVLLFAAAARILRRKARSLGP